MYILNCFSASKVKKECGASLPHRRSVAAQQRRSVRRLVLNTAFRDPRLAETVCRISTLEIRAFLFAQYSSIEGESINHEPGEILIDTRGQGSLQQIQLDGGEKS